MAADRLDIVRRALAAIAERDSSTIVADMDPEVVLHPLLSVWQRTYNGPAGVEQWLSDADELWEDFHVDADGFRELDDETLLVLVRWRGRAKGAVSEFDGPAAALVRFRGDKVIEVDIHLDERRALEAATGS